MGLLSRLLILLTLATVEPASSDVRLDRLDHYESICHSASPAHETDVSGYAPSPLSSQWSPPLIYVDFQNAYALTHQFVAHQFVAHQLVAHQLVAHQLVAHQLNALQIAPSRFHD